MPIRGKYSDLVRIVRGLRGKVQMCMELALRFDYGRSVPWVTRLDDGALRAISGPDMVVLRTDAPLRGENMKTISEFTLAEGQSMSFALTYAPSYGELPKPIKPEHELQADDRLLDRLEQQAHFRKIGASLQGRLHRSGAPLAHHPEGADLRSHRRHGCCADHFPCREPRRQAQLGLPLLLVA